MGVLLLVWWVGGWAFLGCYFFCGGFIFFKFERKIRPRRRGVWCRVCSPPGWVCSRSCAKIGYSRETKFFWELSRAAAPRKTHLQFRLVQGGQLTGRVRCSILTGYEPSWFLSCSYHNLERLACGLGLEILETFENHGLWQGSCR